MRLLLNEISFTVFLFDVGRLDPKEFRACLIACGYNIREDRQGDVDFQRIMANVDPTQTGFITFESFLDFMTRECSEEDSVDQLAMAFKTLSGDRVIPNHSLKKRVLTFFFSLAFYHSGDSPTRIALRSSRLVYATNENLCRGG